MKKILILITTICYISCNTSKESMKIDFIKSTNEITLFYSKKMKATWAISFPMNMNLDCSKSKNNSFRNYSYKYGNSLKGKAMKLFSIENGEFIKQKFTKIKILKKDKKNKFLIISKHFIDTTKSIQQQLKPYIEKMLSENKDTLHIGTVNRFKTKHKELFNRLTKNDSISIQFLDGKKLGERITVPVEW